MTKTNNIPTQAQFDLLYSDYQQLDTPERFGQFIYNRTGFELENSYNETDTEKAWYMLRRAAMINQCIPATDWVKCSERLPELNIPVQTWDGEAIGVDKAHDWGDGVSFYEDTYDKVTHWMPLPTPPTSHL